MSKKSVHGFALIDKEKNVSSFFVLKQLKARLRNEGVELKKLKVGHAGTLDPIATGLLIVAFGEATKLLEYVVGQEKVYEAEAFLGAVTDTYDSEGEAEEVAFKGEITLSLIKKVIQQFIGEIDQIPPKFSAKKIDGVAAYKLAREGKDVEMKSCKVRVDAIDVLDFKWPVLKMRVKCSAGTYIRSLIHDIGGALGCGAYMTELRRVSIGDFSVSDAVKVDDFFVDNVMSIEDSFADFPTLDFGSSDAARESFDLLNRGMFVDLKGKGAVFLGKFDGKIFAVLEMCGDGSSRVKVRKKLNVFI